MAKMDDFFDGSDAHLLEPPLRNRLHSYGGNTALAQDCGIAANRLDEAVTLCDRARDYLSIKLTDDPLAVALAAEMREFIERVEHVCELDDETPNVEVTGAARLYRAASVWTVGLGHVLL